MTLVFYCYWVRMGVGLPPFSEHYGLMFFPQPPAKGDEVFLSLPATSATIQQVDHYHMVLDVTPSREISVVAS
jgi:D-serine deaminase-like pyridoxal phosphate-dependent protein